MPCLQQSVKNFAWFALDVNSTAHKAPNTHTITKGKNIKDTYSLHDHSDDIESYIRKMPKFLVHINYPLPGFAVVLLGNHHLFNSGSLAHNTTHTHTLSLIRTH